MGEGFVLASSPPPPGVPMWWLRYEMSAKQRSQSSSNHLQNDGSETASLHQRRRQALRLYS